MKLIKLKIAILATVGLAVSLSAGRAEPLATRNCTWCHGGTPAQGYTPAPRLAGQKYQYILKQISDFRWHRRNNPYSKLYMWAAGGHLTPQRAHHLAAYFSSLSPMPANDGDRELVARGRRMFAEGIPDANIPSCVACHGPRGQGFGEIPRIGGLAYTYLRRRLEQWAEGYDASALHPMPEVAGKMSPRMIAALASYLSFVK